MSKRDYRAGSFGTMVVLGESHVAGACASDSSKCWVSIVGDLISRFQGSPVDCFNKGIGANAISIRSPGYELSRKPSGLERLHDDVIDLDPDLFILSYGLNDMRAGMVLEEFLEDLGTMILEVRRKCDPVIVLTTVYYMSDYSLYPPYDRGSISDTVRYNQGIHDLCKDLDCIIADIWDAEGQADWVIHPDTVHANDLGHLLIANRVFEAVAKNCSGTASSVTEALIQAKEEVEKTMDRRKRPQNYGKGGDY
ncbi:SGNH/GDSL hydrolase family protein [Planctomycetota bacterium]